MKEDVKQLREKISKMTAEELHEFMKQRDHDEAASVEDFIRYLESNFKPNDKLCYIDCVEGCKYDATPVKKIDLGDRLFKYVKDAKSKMQAIEHNYTKTQIDSFYPNVKDDDVIVC